MNKFKMGDRVRLINNYAGSINKIGDVGIIVNIREGSFPCVTKNNGVLTCNYIYKVFVPERGSMFNVSYEIDLCRYSIKLGPLTQII